MFAFSQDETNEDGKNLIAIQPPPKVQKVDLAALFTARQPSMPDTECVSDYAILMHRAKKNTR